MSIRPGECPACGHERPRRVATETTQPESFFGRSPGEVWSCGLCRYEWAIPRAQVMRPPTMLS